MKRAVILVLLTHIFLMAWGYQVGVGFSANEVSIWRFWEKTADGFDYKILVINLTNEEIEFQIQRKVKRGKHFKLDSTQTIVLTNTLIDSLDFTIIKVDTTYIEPSGSNNEERIFSYLVNGKNVGGTSNEFPKPPEGLELYKYVSPVGLNGAAKMYWIAKNNLFTEENSLDSIVMRYMHIGNPIAREKEEYFISLQPVSNLYFFEISTNGIQKGYYDYYNFFKIKIPNSTEIDSSHTSQIVINYKAVKNSSIFLGITCRTGININESNDPEGEFETRFSNGVLTLPMLIK